MKRKINPRIDNKRNNEYILVLDNKVEIDVHNINVYITWKRKNNVESSNNNHQKKATSVSKQPRIDSSTSSINSSIATTPSNEPTPSNKPRYVPVPSSTSSINSPIAPAPSNEPTPSNEPRYAPVPVPVPIVMPIVLPLPAEAIAQSQPTSSNATSAQSNSTTSPKLNMYSNKKITKYIEQSQHLDFSIEPRQNIFCPWLDNIVIKSNTKIADDHF